jgi:hypothetical protein
MAIGRQFSALVGLAGLAIATGPVRAEPPRCVVELFTSQGCSSCPPADRLVRDLARDPSVVAISWPVDYWDYIGWKDTLAQPMFTARQKAYASARGDGHVYTPQAVINGLVHAVGSDRAEIETAVKTGRGRKGALTVPVSLSPGAAGGLRIEIGNAAGGDGPKEALVWLVRIAKERTVAIGRGENTGESVTYTNVARSAAKVGEWNGHAANIDVAAADLRAADSDAYVVLLQAGTAARPGVILGAAKGAP